MNVRDLLQSTNPSLTSAQEAAVERVRQRQQRQPPTKWRPSRVVRDGQGKIYLEAAARTGDGWKYIPDPGGRHSHPRQLAVAPETFRRDDSNRAMKITDLVGKREVEHPETAEEATPARPARRGRRSASVREPANGPVPREMAASLDATDAETSLLLESTLADLSPRAFKLPHHWANEPLPHGCPLPPDPQATRFLEALDQALAFWPTWGADNLRHYFEIGRARFAAYHVYRTSVQQVFAMNHRAGHDGIDADFAHWGPQESDIERDDARLRAGGEPLPPPSPPVDTYFIHRVVVPSDSAGEATPAAAPDDA